MKNRPPMALILLTIKLWEFDLTVLAGRDSILAPAIVEPVLAMNMITFDQYLATQSNLPQHLSDLARRLGADLTASRTMTPNGWSHFSDKARNTANEAESEALFLRQFERMSLGEFVESEFDAASADELRRKLHDLTNSGQKRDFFVALWDESRVCRHAWREIVALLDSVTDESQLVLRYVRDLFPGFLIDELHGPETEICDIYRVPSARYGFFDYGAGLFRQACGGALRNEEALQWFRGLNGDFEQFKQAASRAIVLRRSALFFTFNHLNPANGPWQCSDNDPYCPVSACRRLAVPFDGSAPRTLVVFFEISHSEHPVIPTVIEGFSGKERPFYPAGKTDRFGWTKPLERDVQPLPEVLLHAKRASDVVELSVAMPVLRTV